MSNNDLQKLGSLYASLSTEYPKEELAMLLGIPAPDKRQRDLQYMTSVFVSSGFNLNGAYFLPTELLMAESTIVDKALDLEHEEDRIVGHLYSKVFAYKDGTVFDPAELHDTVGIGIEKVSMDIITASRIYKARFPEVALDVANGKYGVSMECFYKDFDIIVDDVIVPKLEAASIGLTKVVNNIVQVVEGAAERGTHRVGRVLRGVLFSGCGLVEKPANPDSVILETASLNDNYILDLTKIDSYMQAKQEKESIVIHSLEGNEKDLAYISASYGGSHEHGEEVGADGSHTHLVLTAGDLKDSQIYFVSDGAHAHGTNEETGSIDSEQDHSHKVYYISSNKGFNTLDSSKAVATHGHGLSLGPGVFLYGGAHYHTIETDDGKILTTVTPSNILHTGAVEMSKKEGKKEDAGTGNVDGRPMSSPEICVSFRRYIYERDVGDPGVPENVDATPGLNPMVESFPLPVPAGGPGDNVSQLDTITKENWCTLFEESCPVPGGLATHPDCFRLVLNRTTKETISNYYEQLQENREKKGVKSALSSLLETVEQAKKLY